MSTDITNVENYKSGDFYVDIKMGPMNRRFPSMDDAMKWVALMKKTGAEELHIMLRQIVTTARKQFVYESSYAY